MKFVVCWILQQLYLPFELANQFWIPLRPSLHFAELRKSWENPCVQAWTCLLHNVHILYLWFVVIELASFSNKYPSSFFHIRKHMHKPSQAIRLLRQYEAPLDGFHLITGQPKSWTCSKFLSCHQNELLELYCSVELAVLSSMGDILSLNSLWCLQHFKLNHSGIPDSCRMTGPN